MRQALVELLERNRLLVRGDLEDRVGARVDDPLAGPLMLLAELLDDLRPARRLVAEHAAAGAVHERVDHLVGEAVRVGRHRLRRDDAHQLPVARSSCPCPSSARASRPAIAGAPGCGAQPSSGSMLPKPSASSVGRSRPPTARATLARVFDPSSPNSAASGSSPAPTASKHDDARARHPRSYPTSVENVLGLHRDRSSSSSCMIALAAGVTWVVVRVSPDPNKKRAQL